MASKKDEEAKQAEQEAEIARLQNQFLTTILVPKEFMAEDELPISPAVHIDETAEPLAPARPKVAPKPTAPPQVEPPKAPSRPSSLGAAESLLSGMMPASSTAKTETKVPEKAPEQAKPHKPETDPMAGLLGGNQKSAPQPQHSSSTEVSRSSQSKPNEETESKTNQAPAVDSSSEADKPKAEDRESDNHRGGVFAKAKSLFSNITKKDKKE